MGAGAAVGAPLRERAAALLRHELLAHEDAELFAGLCALLGEAHEAAAAAAAADTGDDEGAGGLVEELSQSVALASMRTPFTSPEDLGIEIETE